MNRTLANVITDLAAVALFVGMIATGYVLRFPLPPGTNRVLILWGLTRHQWGTVHFWISLGLLAIIALHLVLHWKWIVTVVGKRLRLVKSPHPSMLRSGVVVTLVFACVLGLFVFVVHSSVKEMANPLHELDAPDRNNPGEINSPETRTTKLPSQMELWERVYSVFEKRCVSCHGPSRQLGGFRVDQDDNFLGKNGKPPLVVPGQSAESPLIAIVTGARSDMQMLDRHKLSDQEVSLLRAWIDAGANWPESRK